MSTTTEHRFIASLDASDEEEIYSGRIVGLRVMKDALRRQRLFWASCAVLGLVIGSAFHLVIPAKYVAVTTLYLTEPSEGSTYTVADDVNLVATSAVADRALKELHLSTASLPESYQGLAVGDVLLEIKADGKTPAAAVSWAKALANAFFTVRAETLGGQTKMEVSTLQTEERQIAADVQRLNNAITVLSSSAVTPKTSNQVTQMVSERGTDETQLTTLQNQVQQDSLAESAVEDGSYVLDPAKALLVHTKRIFAEDGLSGLVAGLAIGIGIVVVGAVISDRPRRRADVAALLGAPVELSLQGVGEPGWRRGAGLRRYVKSRDQKLLLAERRVLARLRELRWPALALVTTGKGSTGTAAALLAGTALSLTAEGKQVALVDMADGRPLARAIEARAKDGAVPTTSLWRDRLRLAVAPQDLTELARDDVTKGAEAVLVLASANPALGADQLSRWVEGVVVVLRAGKASDLLIEATGQMLRGAGVPALSAILLGADREDETPGLVEHEGLGWN